MDEYDLIRGPGQVLAAYPRAYERELRLSDGRPVFVRPILPSDASPLAEAIRSADPTSRQQGDTGGNET